MMGKVCLTTFGDNVMPQLVGENLLDVNFAYASMNLMLNNQYISSSENNFPYMDRMGVINIDELSIENESEARWFSVLVTDLAINTTSLR